MKGLFTTCGFFLVVSVAAHAQLFDFYTNNSYAYSTNPPDLALGVMTGKAVFGESDSDQWNLFTSTPTTVFDSTGSTAAGVTFSFSGTGLRGFGNGDNTGDGTFGGTNGVPLAPALFSGYATMGFGGASEPTQITFAHLTANTVYNVVLYSRNQSNVGGRDFEVSAPALVNHYSSATDPDYALQTETEDFSDQDNGSFTSDLNTADTDHTGFVGNYIELEDVVSDSSGDLKLNLGFTPEGGYEYDVSGLQLETVGSIADVAPELVPEPGTTAMMLVGAGLLGFFAWRQRMKVEARI